METRQEYAERLRHLMLQVDWHGGIAEDEELTLTTRHFEESDKKRFGIAVTTRNAPVSVLDGLNIVLTHEFNTRGRNLLLDNGEASCEELSSGSYAITVWDEVTNERLAASVAP